MDLSSISDLQLPTRPRVFVDISWPDFYNHVPPATKHLLKVTKLGGGLCYILFIALEWMQFRTQIAEFHCAAPFQKWIIIIIII